MDYVDNRPLVTFALFAYNQEQYIREAIEGAFAQTYEPLEIIISDDCSSDNTFQIMQEMAQGYDGKHHIILRKNNKNLGLIDHVVEVANVAKGEIVVLAAGDDISSKERVKELINYWQKDSVAIFSAYNLIDPDGATLRKNVEPVSNIPARFPWLKATNNKFVYGATSAYHKSIIKSLPRANTKIFSEDTPLNLIIQLKGKDISYCPEALVNYRVHDNTLSNSKTLKGTLTEIKQAELRNRISCGRTRDILVYIKEILLPNFKDSTYLVDLKMLESIIYQMDIKNNWATLKFYEKLELLYKQSNLRSWIFLRISGDNIYAIIKKMQILVRPKIETWQK